jgi:protein-S-isoprenylcysteine O-methyltransferase Ste14
MTAANDFEPNLFQRILPPFWLFGCMAEMALVHFLFPTPVVQLVGLTSLGWGLFAAAVLMAVLAKRRFDIAETPVRPFTESTSVVESGLFRYSRNPMYLAMVIGLIGFGVAIGDWLPFIIIPAFIWIIRTQFIAYEEQLMEARFGQDYLDYKSRIRRWL